MVVEILWSKERSSFSSLYLHQITDETPVVPNPALLAGLGGSCDHMTQAFRTDWSEHAEINNKNTVIWSTKESGVSNNKALRIISQFLSGHGLCFSSPVYSRFKSSRLENDDDTPHVH